MTAQHSPQIRDLTLTALAAAILCVVSPFTLSIGPIPLSLCTLFLYLIPYLVGWKRATVATLVYILLGTAGVPVFSNFGAGLAKVAGPTGGYIVGYLPLVLISGLFVHLFPAKRWGQPYCMPWAPPGSASSPARRWPRPLPCACSPSCWGTPPRWRSPSPSAP